MEASWSMAPDLFLRRHPCWQLPVFPHVTDTGVSSSRNHAEIQLKAGLEPTPSYFKFIMNFDPSIITDLCVIYLIMKELCCHNWGQVEQAQFPVLHRNLGVPGSSRVVTWRTLGWGWGMAKKTELQPPPPPPLTLKPEQLHFLLLWASTKILFWWCVLLLLKKMFAMD